MRICCCEWRKDLLVLEQCITEMCSLKVTWDQEKGGLSEKGGRSRFPELLQWPSTALGIEWPLSRLAPVIWWVTDHYMDLTDKESAMGHKELARDATTSQADLSFLTVSHRDPRMRKEKEKGLLRPRQARRQVTGDGQANPARQVHSCLKMIRRATLRVKGR